MTIEPASPAGQYTVMGTCPYAINWPYADGAVRAAVVLAGFVRDGFMAIYMTAVVEVEGVGPRYAGTATGFVMVFASLGNLLAPPIGNTLADLGPGVPFWFWAGLALTALVILTLVPERERAQPVAAVAEPA